MDTDPDQVVADMEKARDEIDLELRRIELELKRHELTARRFSVSWGALTASPLAAVLVAGVVGLIGSGVSNFLQARANLNLEREKFESTRSLEREKFESDLILKAIETGDPEKATRNLLFLKNVGLIRDPSGRIAALEKTPTEAPVLPSQGAIPPTVVITASPGNVPLLGSSTLTWTSTNAGSCTAQGDWSGPKAINGSEALPNLVLAKRYGIACTGPGGTATAFTFVTVSSTPAPSSPPR